MIACFLFSEEVFWPLCDQIRKMDLSNNFDLEQFNKEPCPNQVEPPTFDHRFRSIVWGISYLISSLAKTLRYAFYIPNLSFSPDVPRQHPLRCLIRIRFIVFIKHYLYFSPNPIFSIPPLLLCCGSAMLHSSFRFTWPHQARLRELNKWQTRFTSTALDNYRFATRFVLCYP